MIPNARVNRRDLLRCGAAIAAGPLMSTSAFAAPSPAPRLPSRNSVVIRNTYVMSMEPGIPDFPGGDVHIRDGVIVEIGQFIKAPGTPTIKGEGMILMPGLIETHWHMWNTLLRSMSGDKPEFGYFRTTSILGQKFEPSDMYRGTRLACAEAISSGITFVHNWSHNIRNPEFLEADLRALRESGLRGRFSYGTAQGMPNTQGIDLAELERVAKDWSAYSNDGLLSLGLAWRGVGGNSPATAVAPDLYRAEIDAARRLGLPVSVHASGSRASAGQIATIAKAGLLDKDMQIVHAVWATPDEIKAMKDAGVSVSISPVSELRIGFGMPQTMAILDAGIPLGLSVDTVELTGNADMFGIMKMVQSLANGQAESEFKLSARKALELATIEGARAMGMADKVGSIRVGKRADVIMVSVRDINMGVFGDPAHMLVNAAQPSNVDTVIVDGGILKRSGKLVHLNAAQIGADAEAANAALRKRAGWW